MHIRDVRSAEKFTLHWRSNGWGYGPVRLINIAQEHGHGVVGDDVYNPSTAPIEGYDAGELGDRRVVLV